MADRRVNVKLTADASDYMSTLARAAAATEALNKKVDEAAQRLNNARRAEASAAEQVRQAELRLQAARAPGVSGSRGAAKAANDLARARANLADKTYDVEAASRKLAEAQKALAEHPQKFAEEEARRAEAEAKRVEAEAAAAEKREQRAVAAAEKKAEAEARAEGRAYARESKKNRSIHEAAGAEAANSFGNAFEREFRQRKVFFAAVVGGALTAGAPLALAGAAALFGGIAAIAGAQSQDVRDSWTALGREIQKGSLEDAKAVIPALTEMADDLGASFEYLRPQIRQAFEATAPLVETFTDAVTGLAENAMPGFVRALQDGQPVMDGFRSFSEKVGTGLTDMFDAMTAHAPAAGAAFSSWGDIFGELLPLLGEILGQGAELARVVLPTLSVSLGVVRDVVTALDGVLPGVVAGLLAMRAARGIAGQLQGLSAGAASSMTNLTGSAVAGERFGKAMTGMADGISRASLALPVLGAIVSGIADTHGRATSKEEEWAQAIQEGGSAARRAYEDYKKGTHWGQSIDEAMGLASSWEDAKKAALDLADATPQAASGMESINRATADAARKMVDLPGVVESAVGAVALVGHTGEMTEAQMDAATQSVVDMRNELQTVGSSFVQPLDSYMRLLEAKNAAEQKTATATAKATASSHDSWVDYADKQEVTMGELADSLDTQITNQMAWRDNIVQIAQWAGADVAGYIAKMGKDGVDIAAAMATGMTAENQRMVDDIRKVIQLGGIDMASDLQVAMAIMDEKGKEGASATVQSIADALGIGVADVRRIAGGFSISLAEGLNPIMHSLGKPELTVNQTQTNWQKNSIFAPPLPNADGNLYENHSAQIAPGGAWRVWAEPETGGEAYIPLSPAKRARSTEIWRETGRRLGVNMKYYDDGGINLPKPPSTAPYQHPISTAADAAMQAAYDAALSWVQKNGGLPGTGALSGAWGSIWQYVKTRVPEARMNSTYRAGDPGFHGLGKAIDFGFGSGPGGAGSAGLALINRILHDGVGANLAELIYDGIGDDRPDLKNGKPHTYDAGTRAEHRNHVHAAVFDQGGPLYPGYTVAYNGTGKTEWVSRELPGSSGLGGGGGVAISFEGATITGTLEIGGDGLARIIDGRVVGAITRGAAVAGFGQR